MPTHNELPGTAVTTMIDSILKREGGLVDHPSDRGGPTNFGITQRSLAKWRGDSVTKGDVRRMTQDEARAIYRSTYFTQPKIDKLPAVTNAAAAMGKLLINKLVDRRVQLYESIVAGDPSQAVFLKGWLRRANEFRIA